MRKTVTCKVPIVGEVSVQVDFPAYRRSVYQGDGADSACYWKIEADGTYVTIDKECTLKHWMTEMEVAYTIRRSVQCRGHIERISQDAKFICGEGSCHSTAEEFIAVFEEAKRVVKAEQKPAWRCAIADKPEPDIAVYTFPAPPSNFSNSAEVAFHGQWYYWDYDEGAGWKRKKWIVGPMYWTSFPEPPSGC